MKSLHMMISGTVVLLAVGLIGGAPAAAGELSMETHVVGTGFTYYYHLDIDDAGNAHAVYNETGIDQLFYNSNVGGAWGTPEFIHTTSDFGSTAVSIAVDAEGVAHIVYDSGMGGNDVFTYATNAGGSWSSDVVRTTSRWYSIDLSPTGAPRVSYYHDYSGLNYASLDGGTWSHEVADSTGGVTTYAGRYTDLMIDPGGYANISYYNFTTNTIRSTRNTTGVWDFDEVGFNPDSGYSKIAVDPDGIVYVAYRATGQIWVARRYDDLWIPTAVTYPGSYGDLDIATDADGVVHVVYNDNATGTLKLAVANGGSYDHYEIFDTQAGGEGPSLSVHGYTIHVLAWDRTNEVLYHLTGSLRLPGDYDGDGDVDLSDLAFLLSNYDCPGPDCPGDIDGDGDTDLADLALLLAYYGTGT